MLSRKNVIEKAIHDCYKEMYAKAQPSADWDQIVKEFKDGIRDKDERVYEQHYLSQEEYSYIVDKYVEAYGLHETWKENIELLEKYLNKGGVKDKYIEDEYDENGNLIHPGYRGYEDVSPLKEQIKNIIAKYSILVDDKDSLENSLTEEISNKVMDLISTCKDFYRFDREESQFRCTCALGASPTSNSETVKKYWKEKTGEDIQIEERNPKLFWYIDNGYTDEDLAWEFEDLGENWKEKLDQEWKDEIAKKKAEQEKRLNDLKKQFENNE